MGCNASQDKILANKRKEWKKTEQNIINANKQQISTQCNCHTKLTKFNPIMCGLVLKPPEFYKNKIGISLDNLSKSRKIYNELGQFDFEGSIRTSELKEKLGRNKKKESWIYIGQFRPGTKIREGMGIIVWNNGNIYEGYFKNGERNEFGRYIYHYGDYYIGGEKNGGKHGQGEYHWASGHVYVGEFKKDKSNGYGTMTYPDGSKVAGQWKDWNYQNEDILT